MRQLEELARVRGAFRGWPGLAAKAFLWKHLRLPNREIDVTTRSGTTLTAPLVHNIGAVYTAIDVFAFGAYECDWDLEEAPVVIDIGANIGAWVLRLAEVRPRVTGICYEPDPAAASYLTRNLQMNGLAERVEIRPEAVSDRTGTASLFQAEPGDGTSSLHPVSHTVPFERQARVRTLAFSEAVEQARGDVSLVKMDCEGAEYDIVAGSPPGAWDRVKRIVVEYHPAPRERLEALRSRFVDLGFAVIKERHRSASEGTFWFAREPN